MLTLHQVEGIEDVASKLAESGMVDELRTVQPNEDVVVQARSTIEEIINSNAKGPASMVESFSEFSWLLEAQEDQYLQVGSPMQSRVGRGTCRF